MCAKVLQSLCFRLFAHLGLFVFFNPLLLFGFHPFNPRICYYMHNKVINIKIDALLL